MVIEIDLTKTENYGIPCCSKHPYYNKGNFSTKRVQVTCFKNGTHTMYLHNPVNNASICSITHTNYENTFNQHTDTLKNKTINEVAVIFIGFNSTQEPILVLLNERSTHGDFSTTHGYYYQDRDKTRGDTFTQYTFNPVNGCNLMCKLKGLPKNNSAFNICVEEQTAPIKETWQQITKELMIKENGSPVADLNTKDCKPPAGIEEACEPELEPILAAPESPVFKGHQDIKVYTLENNMAKANDATKVDFYSPSNHEFFYNFKNGVECVEVRFRNKTLWIHDANAHGNNYPRKVSYNDVKDLLYVHMADLWIYYYSYKHGSWTLYKTYLIGRPSTFTQPPDRTIIYEPESPTDPGDSDLPRGNEVDKPSDIIFTFYKNIHDGRVEKSDYRVFERFNALTFYFEKGAKCVKVHYKDVEVWRHSVSEYQTNYPKYVEFNKARDRVDIVFNSEWYYGFTITSANKWELKSTRLAMKPGALREMLKGIFNVKLKVSPTTLSIVSGMSVRTIRFFLSFASGFPSGLKTLIDKLYNSDMYWETLPAIIINPDHLCKLFDLIRGTSLVFAEARLHNLIGRPDLVLHLLKELKKVGFNVEELLKTLLVDPDKLNTLLAKLRDFGYALNLTQFMNLGKNSEILTYLNLNPIDVKSVGDGSDVEKTLPGLIGKSEPAGESPSPVPSSAVAEGDTKDKVTESSPESSTTKTAPVGTESSGSDSEQSMSVNSTSEGGEGFFQKAAEYIEKHKTEISAGSGTVVSVGVVGTVGAVVYNKFVVGTAAAAAAALF